MPETSITFHDLKLHPDLLQGLDAMGFEKPTPIQEQAIPIILDGKDLIGIAQTGTGKTAAYVLPTIHNILEDGKHDHVNALILAPTRELAKQIDQQVEGFSYFCNVSSATVYGGTGSAEHTIQEKALRRGADIIIATPGKLMSHMNMNYSKLGQIQCLILDEADRMLDMGFYDDIMRIIKQLPKQRQNLLFSATMPSQIRKLAKEAMNDPSEINIAISKPAEGILQAAYLVYDGQKPELVSHLLLGKDSLERVLIFTSTKANVNVIVRTLKKQGLDSIAGISSDLEQSEREEVMRKFAATKLRILVATDVISRGIDIKGINLVLNYDVPNDPEDYVHRIGRTARADATGVGITFVNDKEQDKFARIEKLIERDIAKPPLPPHLGKGPEYDPRKYSSRGGGCGRGGNRKGGGNKSFTKKGR